MPVDPVIYLASKSPRRKVLLEQLGLSFLVLDVDVDESAADGETPQLLVERLARAKAQAGWMSAARSQNLPVLGSDTIVVMDNHIFTKPENIHDAMAMLQMLSGREHTVLTAVALMKSDAEIEVSVSSSDVEFANLSHAECLAYWNTGEGKDKAGGYAVQGMAAMFIKQIRGSYTGIMGLPLYETSELLKRAGIQLLNKE